MPGLNIIKGYQMLSSIGLASLFLLFHRSLALLLLSQVSDAIKKMKCRKTAKPSGIVAEMLKASGSVGLEVLAHLMKSVIDEGVVPADWRDRIIVNLYKGKRDALDRGNYRDLKLTDHVMKLVEHVLERRIRKMVDIDEMQFGFVSGRSATDAVFIVRQLQGKYLAIKKPLFCFRRFREGL